MNTSIVLRLLAVILWILALAMLASLGVSQLYGEEAAVQGFFFSVLISSAVGVVLWMFGRSEDNRMFRKEALAVIGTGWLLASLFGALPYLTILSHAGFADALFESTSGITTTGASVFADIEEWPRGLLFWRAITQWIGGLGVVVFFVAILAFLGAGAKLLFSNESSAQAGELDYARVQSGVLRIVVFYLLLSVACALTYRLLGMDTFDAVCHMFATVATGGFSTKAASIAAFENPAIEWAAIVFMVLGGTSFLLFLRFLQRDWEGIRRSTEVVAYYFLLVAASIVTTALLLLKGVYGEPLEALRAGCFQVASVMTTTGFATADFDGWPPALHILLLLLMLAGGCSGSTAGGAKLVRVVLALRIARLQVERAFRPQVVRTIHMNGRPVPPAAMDDVSRYFLVLGGLTLFSTFVLGIMEPAVSPEGIFSAVQACLFNVGPGFHEVGPAETYAFFTPWSKVFLSLLMVTGRLELFAVLVLFMPSLWRRFA